MCVCACTVKLKSNTHTIIHTCNTSLPVYEDGESSANLGDTHMYKLELVLSFALRNNSNGLTFYNFEKQRCRILYYTCTINIIVSRMYGRTVQLQWE